MQILQKKKRKEKKKHWRRCVLGYLLMAALSCLMIVCNIGSPLCGSTSNEMTQFTFKSSLSLFVRASQAQ